MKLKIVVGFLLVLIATPILVIIPMSFGSEAILRFPPQGLSLKWYQNFFSNEQWTQGFMRSVIVAFFTSIVALVIGTMAATAVNRVEFPGKKIFMNLMIAPISIPVIVVGIALYRSFSTYKLTDTLLSLVLAHSIVAIPLVFVTLMASFKGLDPSLERAAQGLGSTPIGSFFKVTVPIISPGLFGGWLFAFITSLDEVVMSIFITGPNTKTLPIVMWENLRFQIDPTLAAASSILIVLIVLVFVLFPKLIQVGSESK